MENKNRKVLSVDDIIDFDACLKDFISSIDSIVKHYPTRDDALDRSINKPKNFKLAMRYDGWNKTIVLFVIQ